ncbi:glycosyltransferase family 2 protein [Dyadobacter psychrotolerans]|uniref:Glycosyltransferase family 2 protein n=1 Tax=Dyadobacter psychrotolerans TaxID=2541721 RepID=A0A4R5DER0_9BACT|nr:glycosyltransferase family A protein [Dyadobacter psychrotolerans]TDE10234.1 glycosyltransferase family 2 protein [Dyadobacter psychrotolerans]
MSLFSLPGWVKPHLYSDKKFVDLSPSEIEILKNRLSSFKSDTPEVSVVIPVWNEQDSVFKTLSSLSASITDYKTEIIVVNNNSSDNTQKVIDTLGTRNYLQEKQGTPYARQMGLDKAKGKYYLCADADTLYPPHWINLMVSPMAKSQQVTGVYGRYSFIPPAGQGRFGLWFYEFITSFIIRIRQRKREYLNVYGFNMGLVTDIGRETGGFNVISDRKYNDVVGSDYDNDAEDGRMARNLMSKGKLELVTHPKARVFTSSRRLMDDGSIWNAFTNRIKRQLKIFREFT